ncbi:MULTISPECIES: response regulator transcription factor [Mesonia]|uniref:Transcriptional regulatory protein CusR n=1 Tax=Mesonia oceanica TaxID=2687242 RepID=A0AC61Y6Z6_9FLAO|nr:MULTISPECIES: response regulator transcription factor [Mesonia]MAN26736.1 DNA-binding response regulator [Mesonia sp.]MAQ40440.1 DNA-binding response regulator [Mesonia sp.]MBJ98061.1 DNA-binding response regulator [Flavobacteriaceae bacterium]VVV00277.1 Transcriptional regulatory protein CusR [Mesonia oceanica]
MKILLVEDNKRIRESLSTGLNEEGFLVQTEEDGFAARDLIFNQNWDLFIFDIMLPGLTGIELCELIRFKKIITPIIILSALGEPEDKIKALDKGADDYLVKPFHFKELISRIKALNRRTTNYQPKIEEDLFCDNLKLNFKAHKVERNGKTIKLSQKEFLLLKILLEHKNEVVTRQTILQKVWKTQQDTYTNVIDVYISYLRNKIDSKTETKLIHTIKGRGYMISDEQ